MPLTKRIGLVIYVAFGVLLLTLGTNQSPFKFIVSNHTMETYSPKCRYNTSITSSGNFNLQLEILSVIRSLTMQIVVLLESRNGNYDLELINRKMDLCKVYKNTRYEPMVQNGLKAFGNYLTHWFTSCPVNKGVYYLKDVEVNVEALPQFFPEKKGLYDVVIFQKKERLFRVKAFFQILKTDKKNLK